MSQLMRLKYYSTTIKVCQEKIKKNLKNYLSKKNLKKSKKVLDNGEEMW